MPAKSRHWLFPALLLPPLLWGSNAILGRMAADTIPPVTLNVLRWVVAWAFLMPFACRHMAGARARLMAHWRTILFGGLWGIACYNALQYLALTTSSAINVSLIGACVPIMTLAAGHAFFGVRMSAWAVLGALVSFSGIAWIFLRGDLLRINSISFVKGDLFMLAATLAWSLYTWLLRRDRSGLPSIVLLFLQIAAGIIWSLPFLVLELGWGGHPRLAWGMREAAMIVYAGLLPSLVAFFCWQYAVVNSSAQLPAFFMNLTPVFTIFLSSIILGESAQGFHYVGLGLIASGIWLSQRGRA